MLANNKFFCYIIRALTRNREFSSVGRASALQAEGHRFEPCNSHQTVGKNKGFFEEIVEKIFMVDYAGVAQW